METATKTLEAKLKLLKQTGVATPFILADAKDADMAFGIASTGKRPSGSPRSLEDYRAQIREIVEQGLVDIMLMSASTSEILSIKERLFDDSPVTPAVRANDTTDIHIVREGIYASAPSTPFSTATIDHIQCGKHRCSPEERKIGPDLGLYSVTFNNIPTQDLATMQAYKQFRLQAERRQFHHFLEVFAPNVSPAVHGIAPSAIPGFVNDQIVRLLAGVPSASRPIFLKIPYFGPGPMEELCAYDPSLTVGVLGGAAGTSYDAFALIDSARRHGARVALFGRKINAAEHQLTFVQCLRLVADGHLKPTDAVRAYHNTLTSLGLRPYRSLEQDMQLTPPLSQYGI